MSPPKSRLESIDFLRGLVMIVMALDHVRDLFTNATFNPVNLAATTAPYFFTRWITHFCAPVFSLLTGVGAYLWYSRGKHSKAELSRFLLGRGVWLIFLELVVTRCFGWAFNFDFRITVAVVLWILGWSMIVLAGMIWLPPRAFAAVALVTIAAHNLLARISAPNTWWWDFLYRQANIEITPGHNFYFAYVLIPWYAVMMAGFALGPVFLWEAPRRRRFLMRVGAGATTLFFVIRTVNGYGDPAPWAGTKNGFFTVLSFLNTTKYPPSLDYLLMTIGPSLILLALIDGVQFHRLTPIVTFGRVPLFYYVVHITVMHLIALAVCAVQFGAVWWMFTSHSLAEFPFLRPPGWGFGLPGVYLIWAAVVLVLYPLCRWYAEVKRRSRNPLFSYL
ncbi:MAG TPA: heparan-alpha-glucosaminide N-acetyltransferase domain-containing protein [Bryobacteraceae bacterium]|nr:heparan-alpha-glucosaminide N-acetyltransferase domain-containing protein [Bryobacteraceae bacterium]